MPQQKNKNDDFVLCTFVFFFYFKETNDKLTDQTRE